MCKRGATMKKLRILCDADDTIENLAVHWIAELNSKYNKNVDCENRHSWDMCASFPDLTAEQVLEPLYNDNFWDKITPVTDSELYLKKLVNDGHEVFIVTASNLETKSAKTNKLLQMFPFLKKDNIIFTYNKQQIDGDVLVDDGVHNLLGGSYKKLLYNQPYNANVDEEKHDIMRVYSWRDVYEKVCAMAV